MSTTPLKRYVAGIHDQTGYRATWLPGSPLGLGDVGVIQGGVFVRVTGLSNLGIPFQTDADAKQFDMHHVSHSGVKLEFVGNGSAPTSSGPVGAGVDVQFGDAGAFVFDAIGCQVQVISDQVDLESRLRPVFYEGIWKLSWVVVTQVVKAESATILIANSSNSRLKLSAHGNLAAAQQNLANLDAKLVVTAESGNVIKLIGASGLTLLYRLAKLNQSFFSGDTDFTNVRGGPLAATVAVAAPNAPPPKWTLREVAWTPEELDY